MNPLSRIRRPARLLSLALLAGCLGTGPTEVGLGEEFELAPNQSVRISGTTLTVGFRRVAGDSRCPIDLLCVVEGSAGVEVNVFGSNARNPILLDSQPGFNTWTDGTYEVRLVDLQPVPVADRQIKPDEYRARLIVQLVLQ